MITDTSLDAYMSLDPMDISRSQAACLALIKKYPFISNRDIAKLLGWDINRVTPRTKELMDGGEIQRGGKKVDVLTNRAVYFWEVRKK